MGDKVTMNKYNETEIQTAENLLKEGYKWLRANCVGTIFAYEIKPNKNPAKHVPGKIVCTACVPIFKNVTWKDDEPTSLESIVPQILDDAEKQYLKGVIRLFRDRGVWYIRKSFAVDKANCYIFIRFNDGGGMDFPVLRKSDMYKGMKMGKAYTLEELGL